jgi:error-prone DNA polymerase
MGFYSASSIIQDAQRHGVTVLPVCAEQSTWDNSMEPVRSVPVETGEPSAARGTHSPHPKMALRLGFRQVKGVSENAGLAIERARIQGPFTSVQDFVMRTNLPRDEVEALAEAGAFEALTPARREAMWRSRAPKGEGLFRRVALERERRIGLPDLLPTEQLTLDYARVGLSVDDHPMKHLRADMDRLRVKRALDLRALDAGTRVRVAGLVIGRQRPETASGVTFMTLEDETGMVNLIVHKKVFDEQFPIARHAQMVLVAGKLERDGEVIHVLAREFQRLSLPAGEPLSARSRDFH